MYQVTIGQLSVSIVDLIIFIICMISAVVTCIRGFISEFSHIAGLIIGFFVGIMFTPLLSSRIREVLPITLPLFLISLISFVILVIVGYIVMRIIGNSLSTIVESFNLGAIDNILGFVWGLISAIFFISVVLYVLSLQTLFDFSKIIASSQFLSNFIEPLLPVTISSIENIVLL